MRLWGIQSPCRRGQASLQVRLLPKTKCRRLDCVAGSPNVARLTAAQWEIVMVGQPPGRTFISYSRKDGAAFARDLRATLEKENLSVWQDIVALEGGRGLVEPDRERPAVEGAAALHPRRHAGSARKRRRAQEIRLARQEGKSVCPVKGPGVVDLKQAAALARPYLRSRPPRAADGADRQAASGSRAEARADDGAGAAGGFRRAPEGIRRAQGAPARPREAIPSPASPRRCAAPAAMARRRSPRRSPATPTSRTPISTEFCGRNSARSRSA